MNATLLVARIPVRDSLTNLRKKNVGCKILHFINNEDQEALGYKNLRCKRHSSFFTRTMNQGKTLSPVTICLNKLCSTLVQLVNTLTTLKIIFLYVQGCEKRKSKYIITDWSQNRTEILFFINLDRCLSVELLSRNYRATGLEQLLTLDRWLAVEF